MGKSFMTKQALDPVIMDKGVDRTRQPEILDPGFASDCLNVSFEDGVVSRRPGSAKINTTALTTKLLRLFEYTKRDGSKYLVAVTRDGFYVCDIAGDITENPGDFVLRHSFDTTLIEGCESAAAWTLVECSALTDVDGVVGGAIRAQAFTSGDLTIRITTSYASPVDVEGYDGLQFWLNFESLSGGTTVPHFYLEDPAGTEIAESYAGFTVTGTGWVRYRIPFAGTLTAASSAVKGVQFKYVDDAPQMFCRIDDIRAYKDDTTLYLSADEPVAGITFNDKFYILTDTYGLFSIDDPDTENFSEVSGASSYTARYLESFGYRLFMGYVTEGGTDTYACRIRWSAVDDGTDWTGPGAGWQDVDGEPSPIVNIKKLGEHTLVVYKERSIVAMRYVGARTAYNMEGAVVFDTTLTIPGDGCLAGGSVAVAPEGTHYFLGYDNVFRMTAEGDSINIERVGTPVIQEILAKLDPSRLDEVIGVCWPTRHEYHLVMPMGTANTCADTYPRDHYVFNWQNNSWTKWQVNYNAAAQTAHGDTAAGIFSSTASANGIERCLLGNSKGYVLELDPDEDDDAGDATNGAFLSWVASKDFFLDVGTPSIPQYSRLSRVDFWASGASTTQVLTLSYSINGGASFTGDTAVTLTGGTAHTRYQWWKDVAVKSAVVKFSGTDPFKLKMFQPWVIERSIK